MPLYRQPEAKVERISQKRNGYNQENGEEDDDDPSSLVRLCLLSVAANMKDLWVQDYVHNYMDQYFFRYVMGPFNLLPTELLEELLFVLSRRNLLSRAALHLLLLPQLRHLSISHSCNLITANLCSLVGVRCQSLRSLNLSGALNVSSAALCGLLDDLPSLRSLCLAGTLSDGDVVRTVARRCPALEHLDVSRCLHLPPAALLPLAHRGQFSSGPRHLTSLLAMDIGLGEEAGEAPTTGAFLLLGSTGLRRLALDGVGRACELIRDGTFLQTEGFCDREGVSDPGELWPERVCGGDCRAEVTERMDGEDSFATVVDDDGCVGLDESDLKGATENKDRASVICRRTAEAGISGAINKRTGRGGAGGGVEWGGVKLRLRDIQGVSLNTLDAVAQLCPDVCSMSLDCPGEDSSSVEASGQAARLARGLAAWGGQLRCLALRFPGALSELIPALRAAGSGLGSLTLEGVQADGHLAFLELLHSCPKLTTLSVHIDPPGFDQGEEADDEGEEDPGLPHLPLLCSLTLNFSMDERQLRPVLCWKSLKGALWVLLRDAPQLHTLSLTAAPCPLDPVFQLVLDRHGDTNKPPLRHLRSVSLRRSDVTMATAARLMSTCYRLSTLDVSGCWSVTLSDIKKLQSKASRRRHKLQIIWK